METKETNTEKQWGIKLVNTEIDDLKNELTKNKEQFTLKYLSGPQFFDIKSNADYYKYVEACAKHYKEIMTVLNSGKAVKLKDNDIVKVLINYKLIKISAIPYTTNKFTEYIVNFWSKDYNNTTNMYYPANINGLVNVINKVFDLPNFSTIIKHVNSNLSTIVSENNDFESLKLPPENILLFNNGVFNTKTFQFSNKIDEFGNYDFVSKTNFKMSHPSQAQGYFYKVSQSILSDWSDNDSEKIKYLKQLAIASIDGNGRDVYNIILGSGGNGKSLYLNILAKLASGYEVNLDIQDLVDDNKLIELDETTKAILGHELATNLKMSQNSISRLKQITTADPFKINVKYERARTIKTNAVKIQASNTLPKIFENNDAVLRRLKIIKWTDRNFTKLETKLPLDMYVDDPQFIEAFISYIFTDMKPFDEFIQIASVDKDSLDAISNADQVYLFLKWMKEQKFLVGIITTNVLYEEYKAWNKDENPGSIPLKSREFTERVKKLADKFGMKYCSEATSVSAVDKLKLNVEVLNYYFFDGKINYNKYQATRYFICKSKITEEDIEDMKYLLENDTLSIKSTYKNFMILYYLIEQFNQDAIAYKNILDDM